LTKEEGAYTECLQWARWINENVRPAQRSGKQAGLAFMTDMPRLFEQYVSQSVSRAATAFGCRVELQARRPFWGSRSIRPDIILSRPDGRKIILDTKWKMLGSAEPEDADLKQMYIYHQFFEAEKGVLLYPAQAGLCPYGRNFHQNKKASLRCELRFVNLPDQSGNKLNSRLGEQILEEVLAE
jgi:5-methylcytosine-specific restriction enzyme subunit McrC